MIMEARDIRTMVAKCVATIRRSSLMLSKAWKVDVGETARRGYTLPEADATALRGAYHTLLSLELVASEGRQRLGSMVAEVYGPDVLAYMKGETDHRVIPDMKGKGK